MFNLMLFVSIIGSGYASDTPVPVYGFNHESSAYKLIHINENVVRPPQPGTRYKKSNSSFVVDGVRYSSISEWRKSSAYRVMKDMHNIDNSLNALTDSVEKYSSDIVLKKYNKNRTLYDLNKVNSVKADRGMRAIKHVP